MNDHDRMLEERSKIVGKDVAMGAAHRLAAIDKEVPVLYQDAYTGGPRYVKPNMADTLLKRKHIRRSTAVFSVPNFPFLKKAD